MTEFLTSPAITAWLGLFGFVASVIGAVLTVIYSIRAAGAAEAASQAATETRKQVKSINLLADLSNALALVQDLRRRLDGDAWEMVSERSQQIRLLISPLSRMVLEVCGDGFGESIGKVVVQMKVLGETSEKFRASKIKEPSKAKLHSMLADQSEDLVLIIAEVKERMGQNGS
jgi:hypothetical protein